MTGPAPFDEHAERLKIRTAPRPVARINRKVLIAGAGLLVLGLFAAASVALKAPAPVSPPAGGELYNTRSLRTPEGLSALPARYSDIPAPAPAAQSAPIALGPALPGDLGATILRHERERGIAPDYDLRLETAFRPSPEDDAMRARELEAAALADEAARAPVFFRLQSAPSRAPAGEAASAVRAAPGAAGSQFTALVDAPDGLAAGLAALTGPGPARRDATAPGGQAQSEIYNPHAVEDPLSPYQVMAGTLIAASLVTGINSDLPGVIIAQVTQPVYDTVTGRHLLIPQGSRLLGRYQAEVSFGQDRALVTWDRLIFPDGSSIRISAPGADAQGYAGVADRTDHHWRRVFAAAGLATLLGMGAELGMRGESAVERAVRRASGDTINQAGQRAVERNLNIAPTVRVRPGWPVRVIVTRDLILRPHHQGDE